MTRASIIAHWRKGAADALESAELLHNAEKFALALFACHLAVEKALKAAFLRDHDREPPPTHNLTHLASHLARVWSADEKRALEELTDYAVSARYDDPGWADRQATKKNSAHWLAQTKNFLSLLIP